MVANTAGECYELREQMLRNTTAVASIKQYLTDKLNNGGLIYSELLK